VNDTPVPRRPTQQIAQGHTAVKGAPRPTPSGLTAVWPCAWLSSRSARPALGAFAEAAAEAFTPNAVIAIATTASNLKLRSMFFYPWFKGRDCTVWVLDSLRVCVSYVLHAHLAVCVMNVYPTVRAKSGKIVREVLGQQPSQLGRTAANWGEYKHRFQFQRAVAHLFVVPTEGPSAMSMCQVKVVR
jgi:hypothetical protein